MQQQVMSQQDDDLAKLEKTITGTKVSLSNERQHSLHCCSVDTSLMVCRPSSHL